MHRSVVIRFPQTFDVMLRPLLLLCWAATIVSAGNLKNVTNDTNVLINPTTYNAIANSQSLPNMSEVNDEVRNSVPNMLVPTTKPTTSITTTTIPSTTTKLTTTSTSIPTTTTVPTTPAPTTPLPPSSTGKWIVRENNTLCIIVQMTVKINVSYTNNNVTIHKAMDIPSNGTVTGKCGKTEQNVTFSWESQNKTAQNNFTIHFVKNETGKYYSLHHLEISLAAKEFPNNKSNETVTLIHMAPQFKTGLSNSYRCFKEQQLDLTLKDNVTVGFLKVTNLQFQAFRGDNTTIFGLAKDCSFDTPDIVPITVGCALAGLVVIVLIAYLVGRRRSQARGYLSM